MRIATATLLLIAAFGLPLGAQAADVIFTNVAGGNWNNGANWSTGTVPGASDNVYIVGGDYTVYLDMNPTVASLHLGSGYDQPLLRAISWELTVNGNVTIYEGATLEMTTSGLHTSGNYQLTNDGTIDLDFTDIGHRVVNNGAIMVERTCNFRRAFTNGVAGLVTIEGSPQGSAIMTADSGLTNSGAIDLTSSWPVTTTTGILQVGYGNLVNEVGGQIRALLGSSFNTASSRELKAQIVNHGTIHAVSTGFTINKLNASHTNDGSYIAEVGTINFTQTGSVVAFAHTGSIVTYPGATFQFQTGNFVWSAGGTITNNGTLAFTSVNGYFTPSFTNEGRFTVGGISHLYLVGDLTNNGTMYQSNGTIDSTGTIYNNDSLLFQTGTVNTDIVNDGVMLATISVSINGDYTSGVGSKIVSQADPTYDCFITFNTLLTNHGTIELTQTGNHGAYLVCVSADSLINAADGVIRALVGSGGAAGTRYIQGRVRNYGLIEVATSMSIVDNLEQHTNSGTIDVQAGTLTVTGDLVNEGTLNVASGALVSHQDHHFTLSAGAITGDGRVNLIDDTISVTGSSSNDAELWFMGLVNSIDGAFNNTGTLEIYSCTVSGSGLLTNQGVLNLTTATLTCGLLNEGVMHVERTNSVPNFTTSGINDTLYIIGTATGTATLTVGGSHINHGVLILTSDVANGTSTAILNATQLTNGATGMVFADAGSSTGGTRQLNAQISNQGLITVNSIGLSFDRASADHVNSGSIHVIGGELDFIQTGVTPSLTNNGSIVLQNLQRLHIDGGDFINGTLGHIKGTGSLDVYAATTTNNGNISPGLPTPGYLPGRLTMQSNSFNLGATGKLWIEIGGPTPTTEFDQFNVTMHAIMNGELRLALIDGYLPAVNDSFRIINYGSYAGEFSYVENLTCNGIVFDTSYTDSCLWLVVTGIDNDPPTFTGVPGTVSFENDDSTTWLGIWNYTYDPDQHDSTLTYTFSADNDSLTWYFSPAGFLYLYADPHFAGVVNLVLRAEDMHGAFVADTVVVTVTEANTAPVFAGVFDSLSFRADSSYNLSIWGYVSDGQSHDSLLTYTFSTTNDSLVTDFDSTIGILNVSSVVGYNGLAWLHMSAADPQGLSGEDSTLFYVYYNFAPVIAGLPDTMSFVNNQHPSLNMWTYASDVENADDELTYQFTSSNDSVTTGYTTGTGLLILSADPDFTGEASLIVQVSDTGSKADLDTIVINITAPVNEPPAFTGLPDTLTIANDSTHSLNMWDYASDPESADSLLSFSFTSLDGPGLYYDYTPATGVIAISAPGFVGTRGLRCRVDDPQAHSAYDTIIVVVVAPNEPPEFVELPATLSFHVDSACTLMLWDYVTDDQTPHAMMGVNFTRSNDSLLLDFLSVPGQLTLTATEGYSGASSLIIRVTDEGFLMAYDTIEVTVSETPNDPPQFVGLPDTLGFDANDTRVIQLWDYVTDDHCPHALMGVQFTRTNDSLLFDFLSVPGTLELSAEPGYSGTSLLIIRINDETFLMAYDTIEVTVFPPLGIVDANGDGLPDTYELSQNFPNPFNPSTSIRFALPEAASIDLAVYNILGQRVITLVSGTVAAGLHETSWNGRDQSNQPVTSGIYFYRLTAGDQTVKTRKMLLLQ